MTNNEVIASFSDLVRRWSLLGILHRWLVSTLYMLCKCTSTTILCGSHVQL